MTTSDNTSSRRCPKCQHINPQATMADDEACPSCDAIYSRVEAYLKAEQERSGAPSRSFSAIQPRTKAQPIHRTAERMVDPEFVATMRAESLYPTFRSLVRITTWLIYLLAVVTGFVAIFRVEDGTARISMLVGAITMAVIATAAREAALMMADVSDAAVIRAARAGHD